MNKQIPLLTFIFFTCITFSYAQKIDLDKKPFTIEYLELPNTSTLSTYNTYSADFFVEQTTLNQLGLVPATINPYFQLDGYKYTKEIADFNYSIQIDKPQTLQEGVSEKVETVKNADGTTKKVITYVALSVITVPTMIQIKLIPSGSKIYELKFATNSQPIVFQSEPYPTRENAQSVVDSKDNGINTSAKRLYLKKLQDEISNLKSNYCFTKKTFQNQLWLIDEKSAPDQAPFNSEVNKSIAILTSITYNKPLTEAKEKMTASLAYWSKRANTIQVIDKNTKKEKYANLYNLALCQFYLELLDECEQTCQLLIQNEYNKNEGTELLSGIKYVRDMFAKSGESTRHINRIGFTTHEQYVYTPIEIPKERKLSFIEQNKQDFNDLKGSVNVIAKNLDDDFSKPKLTDTLLNTVTYFSSITFEQNGEVVTYKGNDLSAGSGMPNQRSSACDPETYSLTISRKIGIIPPKVGTLIRCDLNFQTNYKRSPKFNTDSLITLIKKYEQDKIVDITNCSKDSIPFVINGEFIQGTRLLGKDYNKKLSADLTFMYSAPGAEGSLFYKTNIGDAFNVKVVNVVPVIVKEDGNFYNITPKAYLVTLQIPEVTLTKLLIGHIWLYKKDYITIKNIEMKVLLFNTTPK